MTENGKPDSHRCEAIVNSASIWHKGHQCRFNATVEVDGRHYCNIHDPRKKAAREKEREKKWNENYDNRMYDHYAGIYCRQLGLTLKDLKGKAT